MLKVDKAIIQGLKESFLSNLKGIAGHLVMEGKLRRIEYSRAVSGEDELALALSHPLKGAPMVPSLGVSAVLPPYFQY